MSVRSHRTHVTEILITENVYITSVFILVFHCLSAYLLCSFLHTAQRKAVFRALNCCKEQFRQNIIKRERDML